MKTLKLFIALVATGGMLMITSCAKDGADGLNGADGATGSAGAVGTAGTNGSNGTNGTNANAISTSDQNAYNAADGIRGGGLYDAFYTVLATTDTSVTNHKDFFRCKQCHGWDMLGRFGAYINRAPNAGRPNIASVNLRTFAGQNDIREVFDAIKNTGGRNKVSATASLSDDHPDFGLLISDTDIWDLVKFLKVDRFNTYDLYDIQTSGTYPTGSKTFYNIGKDGNAAAGNAFYASNCAGCHGTDGTTIALDGGALYVGNFLREKCYETQHKVKFGQLGSAMPTFGTATTVQDVKDLFVAGRDVVAYPPF